MFTLVVRSGPLEGRRIEVESELVLGREEADVSLDDSEVSRKHLRVRPTPEGLEVVDLGSTNGTRVDGLRIQQATVVGDGATIRLGATRLTVEAPAREAATVVSDDAAGATVVSAESADTAQLPRDGDRTQVGAPPPRRAAAAPATAEAFGAFRSAPARSRGKAATRLLAPMLLTYAAVGATTVALIVYFVQR
jgi:hypothetical protein